MSTLERLSTLVQYQLPDFIRQDHPLFVEFLQKYYEFLETPAGAVYELKRFQDNYDVDKARSEFLKYFKDKIIPSFPEESELSTERIIKAARDFYGKKGTPDSFKFLFRALYNQDIEIFFPKLQILKASDGKWILPQAFRLSLSGANSSLNLNLIEKKKAYGSISRASCIIESATRTIDNDTNNEIIEIYVSNVNRLFQNGEYLEVEYIDSNGVAQVFSEKIIGSLSNIRINPNKRGTRYMTGDPVVINGGLDTTSPTKVKAVANVGNVTIGALDSVTVLDGGQGFRIHPNSIVDINSANGYGANIIVSSVDTSNAITLVYDVDAIAPKASILLNAADYDFDNVAFANTNTLLVDAFSVETLSLSPISSVSLVSSGAFFDEEPTLDVLSLFDSDLYYANNFTTIPAGSATAYDKINGTFVLVDGATVFSTLDDAYTGYRVLLDKHFRTIVGYNGTTKTVTLNRPFESNITATSLLGKIMYLDPRPTVKSMGYIAAVKVLNGGFGYSPGDTISLIGTGYGAVLTPTISGSVITGVTVTNRGEGYEAAPSIIVNTSTGSGAVFKIYMMGDGEQLLFDVVTNEIGRILDIILSNRGSDYVTTPNVSLKIYDIHLDSVVGPGTILENDIVYQGADVNNTTFRATVDSYSASNNIVRVFDYSGSINVGQTITVYKSSGSNISAVVQTANIDGRIYPYKYGDGRAAATAEFLNGLIKYNGYYLNTDGQLSSDKKLQDDEKYHNFSYGISTEESFTDYSKTVLDALHPSGTVLIPVHVINNNLIVYQNSIFNTTTLFTNANGFINNCNVALKSTTVTGINENFDTLANVNDIIVINSANNLRSFAKTITLIANNNSLNIESACVLIGQGRGNVTIGQPTLTISGNTNTLPSFVAVDDLIRFNISNSIIEKTVASITGNVITLNSSTGIVSSNSNLIYQIYPKLNTVVYEIIRTN